MAMTRNPEFADGLSTRQNGQHLLKTCLGIFNAKMLAMFWSNNQLMLCTNSMAI
jgi:hypothetical protein